MKQVFFVLFLFPSQSESRGGRSREEDCALDRERAKTARWLDPGAARMEIRPDRFKVVAAKTLGKIYGYVKSKLQGEKILKRRKSFPCHFKMHFSEIDNKGRVKTC